MKFDWKKLLGRVLRVVIAAALGGGVAVATVSNDTVPSFLVSEQAAKEVVKLPTIKPGNDYALTVSIDLSRPSGLPGPKCYTETLDLVLRTDGVLPAYKSIKAEVRRIVDAAFSNVCPESDMNVLIGGALPRGYYGEEMAVIRIQGKEQEQLPPAE